MDCPISNQFSIEYCVSSKSSATNHARYNVFHTFSHIEVDWSANIPALDCNTMCALRGHLIKRIWDQIENNRKTHKNASLEKKQWKQWRCPPPEPQNNILCNTIRQLKLNETKRHQVRPLFRMVYSGCCLIIYYQMQSTKCGRSTVFFSSIFGLKSNDDETFDRYSNVCPWCIGCQFCHCQIAAVGITLSPFLTSSDMKCILCK